MSASDELIRSCWRRRWDAMPSASGRLEMLPHRAVILCLWTGNTWCRRQRAIQPWPSFRPIQRHIRRQMREGSNSSISRGGKTDCTPSKSPEGQREIFQSKEILSWPLRKTSGPAPNLAHSWISRLTMHTLMVTMPPREPVLTTWTPRAVRCSSPNRPSKS